MIKIKYLTVMLGAALAGLAPLAVPAGHCAGGAEAGSGRVWCGFTDGKCSKWPEAALPGGEAALIKKIEAKSRAAYLAVFSGKHNPAGLEAGKILRGHPEISFKTGLYRETTAVNWCVEEERAVYTDIRSLKAGRNLAGLAGDDGSFRDFVEGNAPFIAHELVHMRAAYERPDKKDGAAAPGGDLRSGEWALKQALTALPLAPAGGRPDAEWSGRYRAAEEYLAYLVEESYVGFELLKDGNYISRKGAWGVKWRWGYYAGDPGKYCREVLGTSCAHAGLEDVKKPAYPEIDAFYRRSIARQNKIRTELLSRLKAGGNQ